MPRLKAPGRRLDQRWLTYTLMFIGHYGVAFALKRVSPDSSLPALFLAVQGLDVLFAGFVLTGIEQLRIVPGFTQYNPYDLFFMPYSHGLLAASLWAVATGVVLGARLGRRIGWSLGVAVVSHFALDVPVHVRDLPLLGDSSLKIGLGLWHHRGAALALELAVLGTGVAMWRQSAATGRRPVARWLAAVGVLMMVTIATPFFPAPSGPNAWAMQALAAYGGLTALAWWLDRSHGRSAAASSR
jgi:hypothetical protein